MPENLWVMDRRDVWRTCYCIHVRTAASIVGVVQLIISILEISLVVANLMYLPEVPNPGDRQLMPIEQQRFDTSNPVAESMSQTKQYQSQVPDIMNYDPQRDSTYGSTSGGIHSGVPMRKPNILLDISQMLITLLMVYGAVRGKPSYLMPFFVLRVFDFCYFCLRMVGLFSELPSVRELIAKLNTQIPGRDELNRMDPQLLLLMTLVATVCCIAYKAYVVGVIWSCYKYLMLRNTVIRGVIAYRQDDPTHMLSTQQNLLPDLPDYETAVSDPRYAKKPPLNIYSSGADPSTFTDQVDSENTFYPSPRESTTRMPPPPPYSRVAGEAPQMESSTSQAEVSVVNETRSTDATQGASAVPGN